MANAWQASKQEAKSREGVDYSKAAAPHATRPRSHIRLRLRFAHKVCGAPLPRDLPQGIKQPIAVKRLDDKIGGAQLKSLGQHLFLI